MIDHSVVAVAVTMTIAAAASVALVYALADAGYTDAHERYVESSQEWCDARDGDLYHARAMWHGGLHCELPNGTHVHMSDVKGVAGA